LLELTAGNPAAAQLDAVMVKYKKAQKETKMATAKEIIAKIIQDQPDDASYEEILRELVFERMIEKGLEDSRKGMLISNEEMKKRINSWQK